MTEQELQSLEGRIGSALPLEYRKVLLNYPEKLAAINRHDVGEFDEDGTPRMFATSDRELANSLESLVAMNFDDPDDYQFSLKLDKWPDGYFIIGNDSFGGVYAIDVNDPAAAVYFADPSTSIFDPHIDGLDGYFEKQTDSIAEWVQRLVSAHGKS